MATYTTEQARMRLREAIVTHGLPDDGTAEEYFIRAAFPDDSPCQTCGGSGEVTITETGREPDGTPYPYPAAARCPDCTKRDQETQAAEQKLSDFEQHLLGDEARRAANESFGPLLHLAAPHWQAGIQAAIAKAHELMKGENDGG